MTARITPYELLLEPFEATAFPSIRAEAEQRGTDPRRRDQFLLLGFVGATLKDMVPDDAPADAIDEYAELLYQGYEFWSFGRRLYALGEAVTEQLTTPRYELDRWHFAAPPSCYVQLPYQRIWARIAPDAPFEPVDGCFVTVDDTAPAPDAGAHLRAQLILGLRPDRPGISLVSYRTDLDPATPARYAGEPWREGAPPFANAIPGGERRGYKAITTTSELQALVIRVFHYLDTHVHALIAHEGSAEEGETKLAYVEVTGENAGSSQ